MSLLPRLFEWILSASITASVLVAFIVTARWLLKNQLQPRWTYGLWLLLLLRLMLPWTPESSISIYNLIPLSQLKSDPVMKAAPVPDASGTNRGAKPTVHLNTAQESIPDQQVSSANWPVNKMTNDAEDTQSLENSAYTWLNFNSPFMRILSWIWMLGTVTVLGVMTAANLHFRRNINKAKRITDERISLIFAQCKQIMNIRRNIRLIQTDQITSPALYGVIRPKLILPDSLFHRISEDKLKYIFLHELSHFKRNDVAVNEIMGILAAMHWFNPLIWLAWRMMRSDQEIACDARVLQHLDADEKQQYAYAIIELLEWFANPARLTAGTAMTGMNELKRRIKMIHSFKRPSYKSAMLGFAVMVLASACTLTSEKTDQRQGPSDPINQRADRPPSAMEDDSELEIGRMEQEGAEESDIESLASAWAEALKTRNGKIRYAMMTEETRNKFEQEQIREHGSLTFTVGSSSPWVVSYEIKVNDMKAEITYYTQTGEAAYTSKEVITFTRENNRLAVEDYFYEYEDRLSSVFPANHQNDFGLVINDAAITLGNWDNEIQLEKILGEPTAETIKQLENADTFTGSFIKTLVYDGLKLELFSPSDNGKTFWIMAMEVTSDAYPTPKGVRAGSSLEEMMNAYPEVYLADGSDDDGEYEYYNEAQGGYYRFKVSGGKIMSFRIYSLLP